MRVMRQLLLLRHAKSSWADDELHDRDRPLSERGVRDAMLMARTIAGRDLIPDRVLASPARRVAETLAPLRSHLPAATKIVVVERLYGIQGDYREVIAGNAEDARRLLVIGHNPLIQATALALVAHGDAAVRQRLATRYPTGALAVIDFDDADWPSLMAGGGRLATFVRPRDLAADVEDD
jgi:phosphohistidine phosphatase